MSSNRRLRLTLIQAQYEGNPRATIDRTTEMIERAVTERKSQVPDLPQVVCLQELFATEYPCQSEDHRQFDLAESLDGPTVQAMSKVAAAHEIVIVCPIFERRAPGVYHNSVAVLDADGSTAGIYRKMHIPDDPLFYEKFYFAPGDFNEHAGFRPIATRYAKLGVAICWDQWYPEAARLLSLAGADILLYPTAIGWIDEEKAEFGQGQLDAWTTTLRAHAIANGVFVGAPNRVGHEGKLEFWGHSIIVSPRGETLARGGHESAEILNADLCLDETDVVRTHWPFLRDRRIDAYGGLMNRWID